MSYCLQHIREALIKVMIMFLWTECSRDKWSDGLSERMFVFMYVPNPPPPPPAISGRNFFFQRTCLALNWPTLA